MARCLLSALLTKYLQMPYYSVTVHRTLRVQADSHEEAELLAKLFTCYPDSIDGILHLTVFVQAATPNF